MKAGQGHGIGGILPGGSPTPGAQSPLGMGGGGSPISPEQHSPPMRDGGHSPPPPSHHHQPYGGHHAHTPSPAGDMSPHPHHPSHPMLHHPHGGGGGSPPVLTSQGWLTATSHLPPNLQQDIKPPPMVPIPPSQMGMGGYPQYSWYQTDNMSQHQGLLT